MSAPDTDVKKQEKQHKTPLAGMIWAVVFAVVLLAGLILWLSFSGNEPGDDQPIGAEDGGAAATEQSEDPTGAGANGEAE